MPTYRNKGKDSYKWQQTQWVDTKDIRNGAVTNHKLADGAVSEEKILDGAVTNGKIADYAVSTQKLQNSSVSTAKLQNGAVTNGKIADDAVTEDKIADDSISTSKLQDDSVTNNKIADESVTNDKILDGTIEIDKLSAQAIKDITSVAAYRTYSLGFYTDDDTPMPILMLSIRINNINETVVPYLLRAQEDYSENVTTWKWERHSDYPDLDEVWNAQARTSQRTLTLTDDDFPSSWFAGGKLSFSCTATFTTEDDIYEIINVIKIS